MLGIVTGSLPRIGVSPKSAFTAAVSLHRLLTTGAGEGIDDTRQWDVAVVDPAAGVVRRRSGAGP